MSASCLSRFSIKHAAPEAVRPQGIVEFLRRGTMVNEEDFGCCKAAARMPRRIVWLSMPAPLA